MHYSNYFKTIGTVELAYGTPYLLSFELSKDVTALVWIIGPLSGTNFIFLDLHN